MKITAQVSSEPHLWAEIVSTAEEGCTKAFSKLSQSSRRSNPSAEQAKLLVALFRVWARARSLLSNPLPAMFEKANSDATSPELVTACQSLFQLTEACVGRPLAAAPCSSADLTSDEQGIVALLDAAAQSGPIRTGSLIPHGLPGALTWAAYAVNRALAAPLDMGITPTSCPFGPSLRLAAS